MSASAMIFSTKTYDLSGSVKNAAGVRAVEGQAPVAFRPMDSAVTGGVFALAGVVVGGWAGVCTRLGIRAARRSRPA